MHRLRRLLLKDKTGASKKDARAGKRGGVITILNGTECALNRW